MRINSNYALVALSLDFAPPEVLLANTGITPDSLPQREYLDLPSVITMVHNLAAAATQRNWRAVFGQHLGANSHGPVGFASLSAATIGQAIATFIQWQALQSPVYQAEVQPTAEGHWIRIVDTTGDTLFAEFFFEAFARALEVLIQQLAGRISLGHQHMQLQTTAADRQNLLQDFYNARLHFGCRENRLFIPQSIWAMPSPLSDLELHLFTLGKCQALQNRLNTHSTIDERVRRLLQQHFDTLVQQNRLNSQPPSLTEIAKALAMSERSLIRHLHQCNSSYKQILAHTRQQIAQTLLQQARFSVQGVADILGYAEPANFCRAFKTWTGKTPSEYRRQ